jgi:putative inorganic carbon (hco3(-)) transporter
VDRQGKNMNKNLIPVITIVLLIISIGLLGYSGKITVCGFKIFLPELVLVILTFIGTPFLLFSRNKIDIKYLLLPLVVLNLMVVSSIFSIKPIVSFKETLRWGEIFAAFFLTAHLVRRPGDVKVILLVIILMGIFQSLWGMMMLNNGAEGRIITGYFDNPNFLSQYLNFSLPLTLALLFSEKDFGWKIGWIYCLIIIGVSLYLTRSRGSWVSNGCVAGLFSLIYLYQKTGKEIFMRIQRRIISVSFTGLMILFFILLFTVSLAPGLTEGVLKETESGVYKHANSRFYYYATGLRIIEDFPLIGVGGNLYNQVAPYYIPFYIPKDLSEELKTTHPHNLYIKLAAENGILTLLAFLFFLSRAGKDILSALPALKGERRWLLAGTGGSTLVWLLHVMVEIGTSHFLGIQWGIIFGLAISLKRIEWENEKE